MARLYSRFRIRQADGRKGRLGPVAQALLLPVALILILPLLALFIVMAPYIMVREQIRSSRKTTQARQWFAGRTALAYRSRRWFDFVANNVAPALPREMVPICLGPRRKSEGHGHVEWALNRAKVARPSEFGIARLPILVSWSEGPPVVTEVRAELLPHRRQPKRCDEIQQAVRRAIRSKSTPRVTL